MLIIVCVRSFIVLHNDNVTEYRGNEKHLRAKLHETLTFCLDNHIKATIMRA